jgi:hypothetical protein
MYWNTFLTIEATLAVCTILAFLSMIISGVNNDDDLCAGAAVFCVVFFIATMIFGLATPSKLVLLENEYNANKNELRPDCVKQLDSIDIETLPAACAEEYISFRKDSIWIDEHYKANRAAAVKELMK